MKGILKYFIAFTFIFLSFCNNERNNKETYTKEKEYGKVIIPGERVGNFAINQTQKKEIISDKTDKNYYADKGLFFTFNKGIELTNIIVTSNEYKTDKNISVGDNIEKVLSTYGEYKSKNELRLKKGESFSFGTGVDVLSYPGIKFFIDRDTIVCIQVLNE